MQTAASTPMPLNVIEDILTRPVRLGPYELSNRIVMAPLTRNRAGAGNIPQPLNVEYYAQRATAGLIITEASQVSAQGVGYPNTPGIHTKEQVKGWKKVTEAVHQQHGRIFLQLWHVGRISHPSLQPNGALPVAPSAIKPDGDAYTYQGLQPMVTPRALKTSEIPGIIEQFRDAARNALKAGFDGVEIHGANGYLLDQFLRDGTNHRTDAYGGSVENRARLLMEVTQAVTEVWGADRVGVRISPVHIFNSMYDSQPHLTFGNVAKQLNQFGLAYLHVVGSRYGDGAYPVRSGQPFDEQKLREAFHGMYMANAGYDRSRALAGLNSGDADLIAFGSLFIANPDLPLRLKLNAPLNQPDPSTFYGGTEKGYTDYPFLDSTIATESLSQVA
ncbi:alkene reductase [Candidatus Nitronereus thalassa]|uniref:Alkene reductase n=1 Tax=Candidatus Nitronereus thalassa TaxID=3020898 RepID=A0ABU3KBN8_9BACT|nr:alkene reductase [Candidatus Nitronereus thalassa]MDT7043587.1 alkene reductase [Candidatus Nitronereus thalassa]